jgi:hypothetical protein
MRARLAPLQGPTPITIPLSRGHREIIQLKVERTDCAELNRVKQIKTR